MASPSPNLDPGVNGAPYASPASQAEPVSEITSNLNSLNIPVTPEKKSYFPFLDLPPEIRNKIYAFTFVMSRSRDAIYNIPDFLVHGDGKNRGGIRWKNVEHFYLILVCKKIFLEALPVISAESFMEIKVYVDESSRRREKKAEAAYQTLLRTAPLCKGANKVVLNVTPTDWEVDFRGEEQLLRLASVLKDYKKLKEVTLKVTPSCLACSNWLPLLGFFLLARQGVSLCFELMDYEIDTDEEEDAEEIKEERKTAEHNIDLLAKEYSGKKPDVWIEWNFVRDDREYY
ncbi:hypothetical protein G7Y89_g2144 [Cudoniella acicularis]|uniref:Uncharacterized protein n=1 Tax=Cudoniella acicularis TaxID=354080 RepID=A0A8H4W6S5_9HELO|nr:hypothetical protein G7Y89_g2144 [Cudoniella acicularis]